MTMVERVAMVIFLKEGRAKDVAWEDADKVLALMPIDYGVKPPRVSDYYRDIARAAIEAYEAHLASAGLVIVPREPTAKMADAGNDPFDEPFVGGRLTDPNKVWESMISAALKEKGE